MKRKRKAFTIVELVIVVAVIAILAAALIPVFGNLIEKAQINNDIVLTKNLNTQLAIYEAENGSVTRESQLNEVLKISGVDNLEPTSAKYGYHVWFDMDKQSFVLSKTDDVPISAVKGGEAASAVFNTADDLLGNFAIRVYAEEPLVNGVSLLTDNVFRSGIKSGYYLVDKKGSDVAEAVTVLDNPQDRDDYKHAIELVYGLNNDKHDSAVCETLKAAVNNTTIFSSNGIFEPENPTDETIAKVYFVNGITSVSKEHFTFTVEETTVSIDTSTEKIQTKVTEIVLPETIITQIEKDCLNFENETKPTIVLPEGKTVQDLFTAGSTNAVIKTSDKEEPEYFVIDGKEVHKSDANGTEGEEVGEVNVTAHTHTFGTPEWTWEGYTSATATFKCTFEHCECTEVKSATISEETTATATCTETGEKTYTAHLNYHNEQFESVPNKEIIAINPNAHDLEHHDAQSATCEGIGWNVYDTCSRCDYTTYEEIPALGHNYVSEVTNPTCTEQGYTTHTCSRCNDSYANTYVDALGHTYGEFIIDTAATCTEKGSQHRVCSVCQHQETEEISALEHKYSQDWTTDTEATCTTVGSKSHHCSRCDSKSDVTEIPATGHDFVKGICTRCGESNISIKFENTDKYLYRVGNKNSVATSSLFEGDISNIVITNIHGDAGGSYTNGNITFSGTGVVKITANYSVELLLEVVDGYNVTKYSELANQNSVLLNDITMSSGGKYYLSNATLYGNGFTFDVTAGAHGDTEKGSESNNFVVGLLNANLDNVKIIGKVYTTYGGKTKVDYNFPCVLVNGGDCVIANSYISNCASPVRARGGANLLLKNTILKGGSFCNLDIRGGVHTTIDGLTTINQVNGNDAADDEDETVIVGLGIVFWYEGANGSETITIKGDGIKQYNYVANDQKSHAVSIAQTAYDNVFSIDSKFKYYDGTRTWVNTGILSLYDAVGSDNINTPDGYEWYGVSMLGQSGHLCTQLASSFPSSLPAIPTDYSATAQYPVAPTYIFENPTAGNKNYLAKTEDSKNYCYYDSAQGAILIGFEKGDSFSFDPRILTVTKNGSPITKTITMNGQTYTDSIQFTEGGEYKIVYTYTDPYNYDSDGTAVQSVTYTKSVNIIAVAADKTLEPATFDFNGKGYKQVTGTNSVTYVMPNIDDSSVDGLNYVKKTVGGKTVYYPVVCVRNGSPSTTTSINGGALASYTTHTMLVMVFDGIVSITDNGKIYNASNTNMADGKLSAVESGLKSALVWQSANSYDTEPDVVSSKQCYKSASVQGVNRTQTGYDVEYIYRDDAGNEYHYFVKYVFPAKGTGTNAYYQANATFTVTVNCGANGTVDNTTIKGVKYGTALTSDLNKLMNGTKVIATATPNENYAASWSGLTNSVTKDTTVTLKFVKECTITINCGEGGTVNTQTITGISEGAKLTVDGNKLMVNGAVVATATPANGGIANWSIPNTTVSDDMTIDLTFVTPVTITISAGSNGSVSPTSVKVAPGKILKSSGATLSYDGVTIATATPKSGYEVDKWTNVPTNAITSDTSVSVSFKESGCILPGTLITLADGTQKPVEEIVAGDMLLTWDLMTGSYSAKPVVFNDHTEQSEEWRDVVYVTFSDGTNVGIVYEHGFFDIDLGKYVYLDENAAEYIGHAFIKQDGSTVTLTNVEVKCEYTTYYSPTTFGDLCYYTNGMLSMPGGISGLFNIFDVDTDTMKYDEAQLQADIETYGLLDIEAFGGMITEEMFEAFNGKYLGIAVGKGNLTWEYIIYLAERYAPLCK